MNRPSFELASLFRTHWDSYLQTHRALPYQHRAVAGIMGCRTAALGAHKKECSDECGYREYSYNSCRNRSCPKCQGSARRKWLKARLTDLLPVSYFHLVFTLPHSLNNLILCNKEQLYGLFFCKAKETVMKFAFDSKHLGAQPGFISILHTWGQQLWYHVHLHIIVTSGGWRKQDGAWVEHKDHEKFLYPIFAMSDVLRGKFIHSLKRLYRQGELKFPGDLESIADEDAFEHFLNRVASHRWISWAKAPFAGPEQVLKYISHYTHKIAISNNRIEEITDKGILFRYRDYRDGGRVKHCRLCHNDFIGRFLYHIPPPKFVRIRHFGFLSGRTKSTMIPKIRTWFDQVKGKANQLLKATSLTVKKVMDSFVVVCPECGIGVLEFSGIAPVYQVQNQAPP